MSKLILLVCNKGLVPNEWLQGKFVEYTKKFTEQYVRTTDRSHYLKWLIRNLQLF